MNTVLAGVLAYVLIQLLAGVLISRGIRTESDYLVAGRRIGLGLATFSMFATWFGAETCVGAAGKFYAEGLSGGWSDPFGYAIALLLVGLLFASPLWNRGLTTLADLFRARFGEATERFAALIMAPTSLFWAAAQIRAFGHVLSSASDLSLTAAIAIATVVVILYTCTGGLLADVITDLIQGIAIVIGLLALAIALSFSPEVSLSGAWRNVEPARLNPFGGEASLWFKADFLLTVILGSVVAQELAARILASRSAAVAKNSACLGAVMYLVVGLVPAWLGLMGPSLLPELQDPEAFLPELARRHLTPAAYILFTGALVSAILSTVDSTLLAAASLVSHNFMLSLRPGMSERHKLFLARAGVIVFGLMAFGLALGADNIFELVQQANGVGSAGVFVLMVFGLFTARLGGPRAGAATLAAGLVVWAWGTYVARWPVCYLPSLGAALAVFLVVAWRENRRTSPPPSSRTRAGTSPGAPATTTL